MDLDVRVHAGEHEYEHVFETARGIVTDAVETSAEQLPKDRGLTVHLEWSDEDYIVDHMPGVAAWTQSAEEIRIEVNAGPERWTDALRATVAHEYAHTVFYEASGGDRAVETTWQYVLFEAQAQQFAARVYPDVELPWRTHADRETLTDWWPAVRDEWLDLDDEEGAALFFGSDDVPRWLGYTLSYRIGEELLVDHDIETFPHLSKGDVVAAGDELYT